MSKYTQHAILLGAALLAATLPAQAERIKDITTIKGVRGNPIQGMGVVFGLKGTGDNSEVTKRAVASALRKQEGIAIEPDDISGRNLAVVWVTAELPPFARKGATIDVTVSTIGAAESLRGGTLLMTELKGADGAVYAVAQGDVIVGGIEAKGKAASVTSGFLTVGRVPSGAHVEREEIAEFVENGCLSLLLRNPDFATAHRIAMAINALHADSATAVDAGTVRIRLPETIASDAVVAFIERINSLEVEVDVSAVVVINERTGTIIVGKNVRISQVAISKGNLSIIVEEQEQVSQPQPFAGAGETEKTDRTRATIVEKSRAIHTIDGTTSVQDLARALNAMGLTPTELISIFQALKDEGALQAELRVR